MANFKCTNPKCKGKVGAIYGAPKIDSKTKCPSCKKGTHIEAVTVTAAVVASPFEDGVDALMSKFVIDEHQAKHYDGGESGAAQFTGMDYNEVHRLITRGTRAILEAEEENKETEIRDGIVTVSNSKKNWNDGKQGKTNVFRIQLAYSEKGFSGHGYPVSLGELQVNKRCIEISIQLNSWADTALESDNLQRRMHK